jgi:hypothetical protein
VLLNVLHPEQSRLSIAAPYLKQRLIRSHHLDGDRGLFLVADHLLAPQQRETFIRVSLCLFDHGQDHSDIDECVVWHSLMTQLQCLEHDLFRALKSVPFAIHFGDTHIRHAHGDNRLSLWQNAQRLLIDFQRTMKLPLFLQLVAQVLQAE